MNPTLTTVLLTVATIIFLVQAWNHFWAWIERRGHRQIAQDHQATALARWNSRPRARIIEIGTIGQDEQGNLIPEGFRLNGNSNGRLVPEIMIGPDGEIAWGGYTRDELLEIARRRKEFEP